MPTLELDLHIEAGRVICPASGLDAPRSVGVRGDRIVASASNVRGDARRILRFPDSILLPGLIDLHAHPAREGSKYGVDPDSEFLPRGVTTVLSQGDAGAGNWPRFRETTVAASRTRVRLAINLSARGESMPEGCLADLADIDVDACVSAVEAAGDWVWGIAVNLSRIACGQTDPREVMRRAVEAAVRTNRPILFGARSPCDWPYEDQLSRLRPGDVFTYCFRGGADSIIVPDREGGSAKPGRVHPAVRQARQRGVLFDLGHGMQSFDFRVAEAAIADGFPPDTISTDRYARHQGMKPPHDLPRTMAKLRAAGMPETEIFAAVTSRPARILGLDPEIGSLAPGSCADLAVLHWNEQAAPLVDVHGAHRPGGCWEPVLTVRAGQLITPNGRETA